MNIYTSPHNFFVVLLLTTSVFICCFYSLGQGEGRYYETVSKFDSIHLSTSSKLYFNLVFRDMKEDVDIFGKEQRPKSSIVQFIMANDSIGAISAIDRSKCNAMLKDDTLRIEIGNNDGLTAYGVTVKCIRNKFTTQFHQFFDSDPSARGRKKYILEKQTLSLDKLNYSVGDSIYGTIYVRQVDNEGLKHYAAGMFRTRVEANFF